AERLYERIAGVGIAVDHIARCAGPAAMLLKVAFGVKEFLEPGARILAERGVELYLIFGIGFIFGSPGFFGFFTLPIFDNARNVSARLCVAAFFSGSVVSAARLRNRFDISWCWLGSNSIVGSSSKNITNFVRRRHRLR